MTMAQYFISGGGVKATPEPQTLLAELVEFANDQQSLSDIVKWSAAFKASLARRLTSVDRISVNVNRGVSLMAGRFEAGIASSVRAYERPTDVATVMITTSEMRDATYFAESFRRSGFPVTDYQSPLCFNFEANTGAYLGSIILWQRQGSPDVAEADVVLLNQIRPFLTYLFFTAIHRYQNAHLIYAAAIRTAHIIFRRANLTRREREVFLCRFQGQSVAETASQLNVSEATVRRHIRSIGTRLKDYKELQRRMIGSPFINRRPANN
jgi:DNA-binding CsgD family transcriptional regulator